MSKPSTLTLSNGLSPGSRSVPAPKRFHNVFAIPVACSSLLKAVDDSHPPMLSRTFLFIDWQVEICEAREGQ